MLLLLRVPDRLQAYLLRDLLAMNGITAHVFNEHVTSIVGEIPPDAATPQLWLDDERDLRRAEAVLEAHAADAKRMGPVYCRGCGEENPSTFETCWNCGVCIWPA